MGDIISVLINSLSEHGKVTRIGSGMSFQKGKYKVYVWIVGFNICKETITITANISKVSYKQGNKIYLSKYNTRYSNTITMVKDGKLVETGGMLDLVKYINKHVDDFKSLNSK